MQEQSAEQEQPTNLTLSGLSNDQVESGIEIT